MKIWFDPKDIVAMVKFHSEYFFVHPYLIIVSNACNGVGVLFQAGVLFSRENAKGTALSKVYSEKKTHILIFV